MPAHGCGFANHSVAKAPHLSHNRVYEAIKPRFHRVRSRQSQIDGLRHEPQQRNAGRITVDEPCRVEEIGHPDLMGRQAVPHSVDDLSSVEPDQSSRRTFGTNGVDEYYVIGFRQQSQKRKTKRSPIFQPDARRDAVFARQASDRGGTKPVIAEQDVTEREDEKADRLFRGISSGVAHRAPALRLGRNL